MRDIIANDLKRVGSSPPETVFDRCATRLLFGAKAEDFADESRSLSSESVLNSPLKLVTPSFAALSKIASELD